MPKFTHYVKKFTQYVKIELIITHIVYFFAKIIKIYTAHKNQPNINSAKRLLLFSIEQNTNL